MTFANCLKVFKAVVPGVKADDSHDLEARISCYMNGKEIGPDGQEAASARPHELRDNSCVDGPMYCPF